MENIIEQKSLTDKYAEMYINNKLTFEFVKEQKKPDYAQIDNALSGRNFSITIHDKTFDSFDNLSDDDYAKLMEYLLDLLSETEDPTKITKIKKMIAELYNKNHKQEEKSVNHNKEKLYYPKTEEDLSIQKAKDYGDYAKKQLAGKLETPSVTIDTSKFETLPDSELLAFYNPKNFYKLSKQDQQALLQTSVNRYLDQAGVSRIPVSLDYNMTSDDRFIEYGSYRPNRGTIYINGNLFNNIDQNNGNSFLPLKLLSTVIHEARHHIQFAKFKLNPIGQVENLIQRSMQQDQSSISFSEYLAEPDELDARNAALEYMRNAANITQNIDMAAFYNLEKLNEERNKKGPTTSIMKNACPNIYNHELKFDINNYYINRIREQQTAMLSNTQELNFSFQKNKEK